jgi:hypothetical protein
MRHWNVDDRKPAMLDIDEDRRAIRIRAPRGSARRCSGVMITVMV